MDREQLFVCITLSRRVFSYEDEMLYPEPVKQILILLFPLYLDVCNRCVKRYLTDFDLQELSEQHDFVIKKGDTYGIYISTLNADHLFF